MKIARNASLFARLGVIAAAMLLSQQALAVGTDAGVTIQNQASVAYDVGGVGQLPIPSSPTGNTDPNLVGGETEFAVDRRVDFDVTSDGVSDVVTPGTTGHTFDFTLTNESNGTMDFLVTLTQLGSGDPAVNGNADTDDDVSNTTLEGVAAATFYVDDLAEDGTFDINVVGDAAATLANGDVANIRVTVVAYDPAGNAGAPVALSDDTNVADTAGVENVFADPDNDNSEIGEDGISVETAALSIQKTSAPIEDPLTLAGLSTEPHALPDAVVEYTIVIDNSTGTVAADNIVVTDTIQVDDILFEAGHYPGGGDATLAGVECNAADNDLTDGCAYDGTDTYTFDVGTVAAGASVAITYRVRVNPANP